MERLTKRINGVATYIGKENSSDTGQIAAELNVVARREILERLADYEDTGLTPEGVKWDERVLHIMAKEYYQKVMKTIKNGPSGGVKPKGIIAEAREKALEGRK